MKHQTALSAQEKSFWQAVAKLPKQEALRLVYDHHGLHGALREPGSAELPEAAGPAVSPGNFGHDFSQIPVSSSSPQLTLEEAAATCPLFPTRCPFGGACHTCPLPVQTKLAMSEPGDEYEQEADRVAEAVMATPEPNVTRPKGPRVSKQVSTTDQLAQYAPPIVHEVLCKHGQPLDQQTRKFMEARFGYYFSKVRVHTDSKAAESARAISSMAYTVGRDVVFDKGKYSTDTVEGKRLLVHELVHTIQQENSDERLHQELPIIGYVHPLEMEAESLTERSLSKVAADISATLKSPLIVARQHAGESPTSSPLSHVSEVEALLQQVDPVAGVGDITSVLDLLWDMPMDSLLVTMRDLHQKFLMDILRPYVYKKDLRLWVSMQVVDLQRQGASAAAPETMAELRENLGRLSEIDSNAIIQFFPAAQVPAEPKLLAGVSILPSGSLFSDLPKLLLLTLWRSYTSRMIGMPGSRNNLANAFWSCRPTTLEQALIALGPTLDIVRENYSRWVATGLDWNYVDNIHNIWGGTSLGFKFNTSNLSGLQSELSRNKKFCKDTIIGGFVHSNTPCYREVIRGGRGLHLCVGRHPLDVHVDLTQVVEGRESDGSCNYGVSSSVPQHFRDLGWL